MEQDIPAKHLVVQRVEPIAWALFALACNASCSFRTLSGGVRLIANLPALAPSDVDLELRPLPSTGVARLRRYYGPFRRPSRPGLSLAGFRLGVTPPAAGGFPCCVRSSLCRHAVAITPVEPGEGASFPCIILATAAFPLPLLGRLPHFPFRGLLGVHSRYGLPARGVAKMTLSIEASTGSLPPLPLRLLPAGTTSCRVGIAPTEDHAFSRRTKGSGVKYYVVIFRIIDSRPFCAPCVLCLPAIDVLLY